MVFAPGSLRECASGSCGALPKVILPLVYFLFCSLFAFGQKLKFEAVPTELGLSQNFVSDIAEDSTGFIWVATPSGLNRFDGYGYKIYKNNPLDSSSLGDNLVNKLLVDFNGGLWVGHASGLQVFNPANESFLTLDGIQGISSRHLVMAKDGSVWVVDSNKDIHHIEEIAPFDFQIQSYRGLIPDNPQKDDEVRSIAYDKWNRLWINAGAFLGVVDFNEANPEIRYHDWSLPVDAKEVALEFSSDYEKRVHKDRLQACIGGRDGQVFLYHDKILSIVSKSSRESFRVDTLKNAGLINHAISRFGGLHDSENILWFHTSQNDAHFGVDLSQLEIVEKSNRVFEEITVGITCMLESTDGTYWAGTNGHGLYKGVKHKKIFNSPPESSKFLTTSIYPVYKDNDGNLWFFSRREIKVIPEGSDKEQALVFPDDASYVQGRKKDFDFSAKFIKGDGMGNLWVGNYDGLHHFQKEGIEVLQHTVFPLDQSRSNKAEDFLLGIYDLITDESGQIWVSTAGEFGKFDPATGAFDVHTFEQEFNTYDDNRVTNHVVQTDASTFWIGTMIGLVRFDAVTESFAYFYNHPDDTNTLSSNSIKTLCLDPTDSKVIWIGTDGGGLDRLDTETETFTHFTEEDGLPNETVYGILSNEERELWLSTNKGLCSFDLDNQTFRSYTASDGLQDNEFNTRSFCKSSDNEFIFGGIKGLNRFYPDRIFESGYNPHTAITGLKINNEPVSFSKESEILTQPIERVEELVLNPDVKMVSFALAGMDLSFPERTNYQYQLANFDDSWNTIGKERTITFTSLPYGDYTLNIRSTNRSGKWSEKVRKLRLYVLAPWWQTWWAYLLYAVVILAAIVLMYRFQLKRSNEKREAQRLLELDNVKSRLFTNITHEFRTPITVISGMASMIEDQPEYTETIRKNADNLLQMVNQILDLSKLEANKLEIRYKHGNLVEYIRYLTESLSGTAIQQKKQLVFHSDPEEINMDYDEVKIRHIIYNLLSNALKFTNAGDRIDISLRKKEDEKLFVTVRDTGIGIAKGKLPHIFNRFYQADDSSTRAAEGTGIGLSLCYELVKLLDGQMEVESEEGVGSTFSFSLPIHSEYAQGEYEPFVQTIPEPADRELPVDSREKKPAEKPLLLLIEDNYEIVRFIELLLDGSYSILHAENGAIGIDVAISNIPDIIISDVMMPMKNGYEVTETLKNDIRTSHIPIVLLTAKSTQADRNTGLEKGADAYLHKPFDKRELQIRLKKLIELRQSLMSKFKGLEESDQEGDELENRFMHQVKHAVLENLDNSEFKVEDLENAVKLSKMQLYRKLKALTGMSPTLVVRDLRLTEASKLIRKGDLTVSEVAYQVGFSDPSYFTRAFKEKFDIAPSQYK